MSKRVGDILLMQKRSIVILDSSTAEQIAAGEVVERPASVVKELVENSLDANARHITIEVEGGGLRLLRVRDDGSGIDKEEVPLAFARHATSKIRQAQDLAAIKTLGFRGEALPSIAAVSRVEMETRTAGSLTGTKVKIAGGELNEIVETGCPPGTVVTVTDLFYNTPARRRYMKKPAVETRAVAVTVEKLALAHPDVAFNLSLDGRRSLLTPGDGDLRAVIAALYGLETGRELLPVQGSNQEWQLQGFISPPWMHRSSRSHQTIIVNGRYIYNRSLTQALESCYRAIIPNGRHPLFILHLFLESELVDVNVHPAKMEVRFQQEYELTRQIAAEVKKALLKPGVVAPVTGAQLVKKQKEVPRIQQSFSFQRQEQKAQAWGDYILKETGQKEELLKEEGIGSSSSWSAGPAEDYPRAVPESVNEQGLPPLRLVGQIFGTYILAEAKDGLYIIDQHAAHELCRFVKLQSKADVASWPGQMLEPPVTLQLSPAQTVKLVEQIVTLRDLGFILENFGGNTFLLRSLPVGVPPDKGKEVLVDFLEGSFLPAPERLLKLIACHGAIKAGEQLSRPEMEQLLDELRHVPRPYTCPHGRPAVVRLERAQLAHFFKRTGEK
ncbi:MAG: DNA mismatch repair endonuclease MutL [Clostridia bacterium]|nr:DNA mismatch repair endonuclease MutL [Clostridia bacterium]